MTPVTTQPWAHCALVVSTLSIGLFLPPASGQEPAHAGKSQGPVVILPPPGANFGMVEAAPGSLHLPGKEYRSGEGWWALSCDATCKLSTTRRSSTIAAVLLFSAVVHFSTSPSTIASDVALSL